MNDGPGAKRMELSPLVGFSVMKACDPTSGSRRWNPHGHCLAVWRNHSVLHKRSRRSRATVARPLPHGAQHGRHRGSRLAGTRRLQHTHRGRERLLRPGGYDMLIAFEALRPS